MLEEQSRIYTSLNKLIEKEKTLKKEVDKKGVEVIKSQSGGAVKHA